MSMHKYTTWSQCEKLHRILRVLKVNNYRISYIMKAYLDFELIIDGSSAGSADFSLGRTAVRVELKQTQAKVHFQVVVETSRVCFWVWANSTSCKRKCTCPPCCALYIRALCSLTALWDILRNIYQKTSLEELFTIKDWCIPVPFSAPLSVIAFTAARPLSATPVWSVPGARSFCKTNTVLNSCSRPQAC